jgi:hypothetical protein
MSAVRLSDLFRGLGVLHLMYLEAKQDHLIRRVPHTGLPTSKLHRHAWAGWPVPVHVWWYLADVVRKHGWLQLDG